MEAEEARKASTAREQESRTELERCRETQGELARKERELLKDALITNEWQIFDDELEVAKRFYGYPRQRYSLVERAVLIGAVHSKFGYKLRV